MNMKKVTVPVVLCALSAVMVSCETTGDPRAGGIFWSPTKAQARQDALLHQQSLAQGRLDGELSRTAALKSQIATLRRQIAAKQAALQNTSSVVEANALRSEINSLQSKLNSLTSL